MQVTITVLPVSLSLVHIPRSRLTNLSHPVLRQILHPSPAFLNITCNEIELSIFAEHHMLADFDPIARKDRQRQRSRSGSANSRKSVSRSTSDYEPVEISYEKWSVFQIDSHSDQTGNSGTRVHDLSAPLAAAGISILYQSSYTSDFIFVKEFRLREAMNLFASAGFNLYTSDANPTVSPSLSPVSDDRASLEFSPSSGAVLTRDLSGQQSPRVKSHSPTSGEVRVLEPDLACVGLSDEIGVDHWGLKIVKLVAFPDLIPPSPRVTSDSPYPDSSPVVDLTATSLFLSHRSASDDTSSCSSSSDDDGYFSHSPQNVSTTSLTTSTSRSYSDLQSLAPKPPLYSPPSKHFVSTITPLSPITPKQEARSPSPPLAIHSHTHSTHAQYNSPRSEHRVPFFSFTRTPEGSSLTADVRVLATLFPPHERHMVICGGELDAADYRLEEGLESSDEEDEAEDVGPRGSSLKCLQIDLRRFGLDKHGLVNRFSRVLEENGINHMYSSTFKTANLLAAFLFPPSSPPPILSLAKIPIVIA
ncbi:hypothetical protein NLJ89_g10905 [Agrocybe chaxingu]|uniref:CASTOR ACT domain-containing protein n=1 Tax=Agrocybe chaxingu TaxID=84603 RepID=A0A9W8JXA2_9AGAR|nr:hypothetical protein NLJ89_g10905 [Agrocybe chaxingu]